MTLCRSLLHGKLMRLRNESRSRIVRLENRLQMLQCLDASLQHHAVLLERVKLHLHELQLALYIHQL